MVPPEPGLHQRAAAWAAKKAPFRLVSRIRSQSASSTSSEGQTCSMPALLTRMSSPPKASAARRDAGPEQATDWTSTCDRHRAAAGRGESAAQLVEPCRIAPGDRDVGAEAGEADRHRRADAAAGAGDQAPCGRRAKVGSQASSMARLHGTATLAARPAHGQCRARPGAAKGVAGVGAGQGPMVRLDGVSRRFGATLAVEGVSLALAQGAFLTILGPSGCGKTTLLRMIAGFIAPCRRDRDPWPAGGGLAALAAADRHGVPEAGAVPASDRVRQCRLSVADAGLPACRDRGAGRALSGARPTGGPIGSAGRTSCRAGSSNGWRSRGRWCSSPTSCCSTSRWRRSTASCARTCSSSSGASSRSWA